jgi:hypothetical protein
VRLTFEARPARQARQKSLASVGVSPPNLFFRSFRFVIRAEAALANASTGICCCSSAWTTGSKYGGDESESGVTVAWNSSDAQTHRENEILFSPLPVGERSRAKRAGEGDRDFDFKLRTPSPQPSPHRGEGEENASRERESIPLPPTRAARGGEGLGGTFLVRPPPRLISLT